MDEEGDESLKASKTEEGETAGGAAVDSMAGEELTEEAGVVVEEEEAEVSAPVEGINDDGVIEADEAVVEE